MQGLQLSNPHKYAKENNIDSVMLRKIIEYCGFQPALVTGTTKLYEIEVFKRVVQALDALKQQQ